MDPDEIEECACRNGWRFSWDDYDMRVIAFSKQQLTISIQWTTGSVRTTVHRSQGGESTIETERCSLNQVKGILKNPSITRIRHLDSLALQYGWESTRRDEYYGNINYMRHGCSMIVWYSNGFTIRTITHGRGNAQLLGIRAVSSLSMLRQIFHNPTVDIN